MKYNSPSIIVHSLVLQSKMAITTGDIAKSIDLLQEAIVIARKHELEYICELVLIEECRLMNMLDKWKK